MFPFAEHVALFGQFLDRRQDIVQRIESSLLNVGGKDLARFRHRAYVEQQLDACFFSLKGLPQGSSRLTGQLTSARVADGFEAISSNRYGYELDPPELIPRAHHHWEYHAWPGTKGRRAYAETVYAVYMLRQLESLSLRVWDEGNDRAGERLEEIQQLLNRLNEPATPNVFVRDARWLIHTAQGPLTTQPGPYFKVARQIAESFSEAERLELHKAGAKLIGNHLRSQLRYRMWETNCAIDDVEILAVTRNSNSIDGALLIQDLVPLLEGYEVACAQQDLDERVELADAILQGMSADPELFLVRLDLLGPCTMNEDVFIQAGEDGGVQYSPLGKAQMVFLERYKELVGRLAVLLKEDANTFDPSSAVYSPHGITYGFCADILSDMAESRLLSRSSYGLGLEDTFASRGKLEEKLARATGWHTLPRREGDRKHLGYSVEWAAQVFARLMNALAARALHKSETNASSRPNSRLFVNPERSVPSGTVSAREWCFTSDATHASSRMATVRSKGDIVTDRKEGRFLASAQCDGEWFAISKVILTVLTSKGIDALIPEVPPPAVELLRLTCPGLVVTSGSNPDDATSRRAP